MRRWASSALLWILVVALVARVAVLVATPDYTPIFDAADYDRHAASIADGNGYPTSRLELGSPTAFRPPLYPLALVVVKKLGGGWTAERVLGALLGVATVLLVFLIAQRMWDRRVAIAAGAIAAVFPPLVVLNASLLSEVLFLPLTLASLLALLVFRDTGRLRWAAAAGVLCGLAALTRTSGLPVVVALALGAWVVRPRLSRAALVAPAVVVAATLVTIAPWVIRNAVEFHRYVGLSTATGFAVAGTYSDESRAKSQHPGEPFVPSQLNTFRDLFAKRGLDEAALTGKLNQRGLDFMRAHPGYVLETTLWNIPRVFDIEHSISFRSYLAARTLQAAHVEKIDSPLVYLGSLYVVLVAALVGVVAQVRRLGPRRAPGFVWLVPLLSLVPALVIYGLARYRAPVDPFVVLLAAVAVVAVYDHVAGRRVAGASP
jgi:4-amino-4-deoxy-L-arabinose transferase-like glycosyltransferase